MVVAVRGRTEKSLKRGVACIKRNKPPTTGWWTMGEMASVPNPMSSLWGKDTAPKKTPQGLFAGEQASPRPRLVLGAADRSSSPRDNQLEPHSSSLQELTSVAAVVGIHPALAVAQRFWKHKRKLWFRMSSKNPPVLRHRHPRLNINSGSLPSRGGSGTAS